MIRFINESYHRGLGEGCGAVKSFTSTVFFYFFYCSSFTALFISRKCLFKIKLKLFLPGVLWKNIFESQRISCVELIPSIISTFSFFFLSYIYIFAGQQQPVYVCLVLINSATTKRTTMKIFPSTPTHIPKVLIPMCAGSSNCFWPHNDTGKLSNKYTFTINIQWCFAFYSVGVPFLLGSEFLFSVSLFPGCCFFNSPLPCMLVSAAVFLIK